MCTMDPLRICLSKNLILWIGWLVGLVIKLCLPLVTPWTVACLALLSMGFSRQEYWTGLPFPSPGDLPYPGIESETLLSPTFAGGFLTTAPPGKPLLCTCKMKTHWSKLVYQQQAPLISFLSELYLILAGVILTALQEMVFSHLKRTYSLFTPIYPPDPWKFIRQIFL